jgi:mono/diheme cytochrome c family protein
MKILIKALLTAGSIAASAAFLPALADRDEGGRFVAPPEAVRKECGSCHMVFPPQMLPARSWTAVMEGLASHFGENASLDAEKKKQIADWLRANAGDARGGDGHYLRGVMLSQTPLRITETYYWIKEHGKEVRESDFTKPDVKSKANCVACHKDAAKGAFGDD